MDSPAIVLSNKNESRRGVIFDDVFDQTGRWIAETRSLADVVDSQSIWFVVTDDLLAGVPILLSSLPEIARRGDRER